MLLLVSVAHAVSPSQRGDVVVTEFMADTEAVAAFYGEWIEIRNHAGTTLDLNGVEIALGTGDTYTISGAPLVGVDDYLVLGAEGDPEKNGGAEIDVVYSIYDFDIYAPDDSIELKYDGTTLDLVDWGAGWILTANAAHAASRHIETLEWANDLSTNWCASITVMGDRGMFGSPGAVNDHCGVPGVDDDGDGTTEADGDCDDTDPAIGPHAIDGDEEPYGAADDDADCDGVRDDGETDDDADGYNEIDGDCDDAEPGTFPGAAEAVDEVDNDCNGCADDLDDDLDGYTECNDADCDDADASVHSLATEIPYDGVDQDCDGADVCDADADGHDAEECGGADCADKDAAVHPGATEVDGNGIDDDCSGVVDVPVTDTGEPSDEEDTGAKEGSEESGCGCGSTSGIGLAPLILGLALVRARARM